MQSKTFWCTAVWLNLSGYWLSQLGTRSCTSVSASFLQRLLFWLFEYCEGRCLIIMLWLRRSLKTAWAGIVCPNIHEFGRHFIASDASFYPSLICSEQTYFQKLVDIKRANTELLFATAAGSPRSSREKRQCPKIRGDRKSINCSSCW